MRAHYLNIPYVDTLTAALRDLQGSIRGLMLLLRASSDINFLIRRFNIVIARVRRLMVRPLRCDALQGRPWLILDDTGPAGTSSLL